MSKFQEGHIDFKHLFSSFNTDPAHRGFINGATSMIMQSEVDADVLIYELKEIIQKKNRRPSNYDIQKICEYQHINIGALMDNDAKRVIDEVEAFYEKWSQ